MLTLWGQSHRHCDRVNRRDFLRIGALGLGGLTLPDLLRLRAESKIPSRPKSVIMICLSGGPSHIDMYDLKPDAPDGIRGEFKPIQTNVPGFDICEHFPLQARIADQLALVRTIKFIEPMEHELEEVYSGFPKSEKRPCFGSAISRFGQGGDPRVPRYVSLDQYSANHAEIENPRYLGSAHRAFLYGSQGVKNLGMPQGFNLDKVNDRKQLLAAFDTLRRDIDTTHQFNGLDAYHVQAFDMITSPKAREAFDLSLEPERVRNRYGTKDDKYTYVSKTLDNRWEGDKFLLARRLVEAGVSVVTMRIGSWDHHGNVIQASGGKSIWYSLSTVLPHLDRSISALVTDLRDRGLDKDVLVLLWGEFGRTPRISQAGRDHWPSNGFALFAGGSLQMGQVIGETDAKAAQAKTRPLGPQNILATVYHALGIDPSVTVPDFTGRPMYLLDDREPITELVG